MNVHMTVSKADDHVALIFSAADGVGCTCLIVPSSIDAAALTARFLSCMKVLEDGHRSDSSV